MKRYGEYFTLTESLLSDIADYMNDEVREKVHIQYAHCEPEEFLKRYLELDSKFEEFLVYEFGIEI